MSEDYKEWFDNNGGENITDWRDGNINIEELYQIFKARLTAENVRFSEYKITIEPHDYIVKTPWNDINEEIAKLEKAIIGSL